MTTQELLERLTLTWKGYGTYKVTIEYRKKFYSCICFDSMMWDTYKGANTGYTYKQALQYFYNECKRKNQLD